jgi:hypothetical protein
MHPQQPIENLLDRLFTDSPAWAVLDAARDPDVLQLLSESGLDHCCLYAGNISKEIAEVAPYLARLDRKEPSALHLIEEAWGNSWGIFLRAECQLDRLRDHFRRFLKIPTEQGANVIFRFYDPRVLRLYLPSCTEAEKQTFFGPVTLFFLEGRIPGAANIHLRRGDSFDELLADLSRPPSPPERERLSAQASWSDHVLPRLVIRRKQMEALSSPQRKKFEDEMVVHLTGIFPARLREEPEEKIRELVRRGMNRAFCYGIDTPASLAQFIEVMVAVAPDFDERPENASLRSFLDSPDVPGDTKAGYVHQQLMPRQGA